MLAWDRKFLTLLQGIARSIPTWTWYMYLRYVDDCNTALEELPLGSRWEDGKVVVKEEFVEEDEQLPGDLRTARVICEAANMVDNMVRMVQY